MKVAQFFFEARRISHEKKLRNCPRMFSALILWVRKNPAKFPQNFPTKNQEHFIDKLLQARRENTFWQTLIWSRLGWCAGSQASIVVCNLEPPPWRKGFHLWEMSMCCIGGALMEVAAFMALQHQHVINPWVLTAQDFHTVPALNGAVKNPPSTGGVQKIDLQIRGLKAQTRKQCKMWRNPQ